MISISVSTALRGFLYTLLPCALLGCSQPDAILEASADGVTDTAEAQVSMDENVPKTREVETGSTSLRSAESHVHGGASLSIVLENNTITIEVETPLYNLLGFEYAPETPSEKAKLAKAEARLIEPESLIIFNAEAKCMFISPRNIALFKGDKDHDNHDHDDHQDIHDDHQDIHDDHQDHDESEGEQGNHKGAIFLYEATCGAISDLKSVQINLFEAFPNFTDIDLVYLGPSRQMQMELSPSQNYVDLNP